MAEGDLPTYLCSLPRELLVEEFGMYSLIFLRADIYQ